MYNIVETLYIASGDRDTEWECKGVGDEGGAGHGHHCGTASF